MKLLIIACLFLTSCGWWTKETKDSEDPGKNRFELLQEKKDLYESMTQLLKNENGILPHDGDTLWLNSLYALAGGNVNLDAFLYINDSICREPGCKSFENNVSKSNCSYDGILPYAMARFVNKELDKLEGMIERADKYDRYMCEGGLDEYRKMNLILYYTIKAAIKKLKNEGLPERPNPIDVAKEYKLNEKDELNQNSDDVIPAISGYRAHLTMLHIDFVGMIYDGVNQIEYKFIEYQAKRQPKNALYQAIYHAYNDGDQSDAINMCFNDTYFPSDKLPTNENYCTEYLWQRDEENDSGDWLPCDEKRQHRGVDLAIAAKKILMNKK